MRKLFVINNPAFFIQQHAGVADACLRRGEEVHVAAPDWAGAEQIQERGFFFHPIGLRRGRVNPLSELRSIGELVALYRNVKPDLVHQVTLKPILFGTLAARLAKVPAVVNSNTGLGYLFIDESPLTRLMRGAFETSGRLSLRHPNQVDLFLNPDDRQEFVTRGLTTWERSIVITGPGVESDVFPYAPEPAEAEPIVLLPARVLSHKGIREFVEAAKVLRSEGVRARFVLAGEFDSGNHAAIPEEEVRSWVDRGYIEYWGHRTDMSAVLQRCAVCVLPSYREGLGRVLVEAALTGRALIAANVPGCREVVRHGFNGLLVRPADAGSLATAIRRLVGDRQLRDRFGAAGRLLAEQQFSLDVIVDQTLAVHDRVSASRRIYPVAVRPVLETEADPL